jgi:hypothetical protein
VKDTQDGRHRGDARRDRNQAPPPAAGIAVLALTEDVAHSRTARRQPDVLDITITLACLRRGRDWHDQDVMIRKLWSEVKQMPSEWTRSIRRPGTGWAPSANGAG